MKILGKSDNKEMATGKCCVLYLKYYLNADCWIKKLNIKDFSVYKHYCHKWIKIPDELMKDYDYTWR